MQPPTRVSTAACLSVLTVVTIHHHTLLLWRVARTLAISLIGSGCAFHASGEIGAAGNIEVRDSQIIARSQRTHELYWLDNARAIVIGHLPDQPASKDSRAGSGYRALIWNTSENEIEPAIESTNVETLCVSRGYVRLTFRKDGVTYVRTGVLSNAGSSLDAPPTRAGDSAFNPISCREYDAKHIREQYGRWTIPLLNSGEYLDLSSPNSGTPMRYFPLDSTHPVVLKELPWRRVDPTPRFSEFADQYILSELRSHLSSGAVQRFWLLDRRGRVSKFSIPPGPWLEGATTALPIKGGWVMASKALALSGSYGAAGIYLVRAGVVKKVLTGYPHAIAVAPNGCKTAVAINVEGGGQILHPVVKALDFCERGD